MRFSSAIGSDTPRPADQPERQNFDKRDGDGDGDPDDPFNMGDDRQLLRKSAKKGFTDVSISPTPSPTDEPKPPPKKTKTRGESWADVSEEQEEEEEEERGREGG